MKSPIETLRSLSEKSRERIRRAEEIAEKMRAAAEAARRAGAEEEEEEEE